MIRPESIDEIIKPVYKERSTQMSLTFLERLEAKGESRGKQDMVLAILRNKFTKIPAKIETAIRGIHDPIVLESLGVHASSCRTLKEFTADLE